jgi:hypothetical protein
MGQTIVHGLRNETDQQMFFQGLSQILGLTETTQIVALKVPSGIPKCRLTMGRACNEEPNKQTHDSRSSNRVEAARWTRQDETGKEKKKQRKWDIGNGQDLRMIQRTFLQKIE